jgi:hypothetical protein
MKKLHQMPFVYKLDLDCPKYYLKIQEEQVIEKIPATDIYYPNLERYENSERKIKDECRLDDKNYHRKYRVF